MGTTICSRCKAWINDREWRCRSCGKLLPGLFGQRRWLDTIFSKSRSQARTLLVVLVGCFLLELLVSQFSPDEGERPHFSLDPTGLGMLRAGAVLAMGRHGGPNPLMRSEPWRLVTAMLLHGGVFHILMNGLSLLSLGMFVEALFGPAMFWIVFTLTGVVGNLVVVFFSQPGIAIGASGGIFGLFGALLGWTVRRGGTFGKDLRRQLLQSLVINAVISVMPGVSMAAHAGGFAAGFVLVWLLPMMHERSGREPDGVRFVALGCLALLLVCAVCAAVSVATTS
jgi:membrane associated rhomboid family serine protease